MRLATCWESRFYRCLHRLSIVQMRFANWVEAECNLLCDSKSWQIWFATCWESHMNPCLHFISCANVICKFELKRNAKLRSFLLERSNRHVVGGWTGPRLNRPKSRLKKTRTGDFWSCRLSCRSGWTGMYVADEPDLGWTGLKSGSCFPEGLRAGP